MSIEYRLTLAGQIPMEDIAQLVAPDAGEERTSSGERMLRARSYDDLGYVVTVTSGEHGYYDAEDDGGALWVWEPDNWVDVDFHMRKDTLVDEGVPNMLATVAKVLAGRTEDAALVLNGNTLLLTRVAGTLRQHNAAEWDDEQYNSLQADRT